MLSWPPFFQRSTRDECKEEGETIKDIYDGNTIPGYPHIRKRGKNLCPVTGTTIKQGMGKEHKEGKQIPPPKSAGTLRPSPENPGYYYTQKRCTKKRMGYPPMDGKVHPGICYDDSCHNIRIRKHTPQTTQKNSPATEFLSETGFSYHTPQCNLSQRIHEDTRVV
jgi:hypothetical protein